MKSLHDLFLSTWSQVELPGKAFLELSTLVLLRIPKRTMGTLGKPGMWHDGHIALVHVGSCEFSISANYPRQGPKKISVWQWSS